MKLMAITSLITITGANCCTLKLGAAKEAMANPVSFYNTTSINTSCVLLSRAFVLSIAQLVLFPEAASVQWEDDIH